MSLQVWLPLNGDLHNQGLSNYNLAIFRGSEVYNNNGKIGKCFYANGVNTIKILNIIPNFYNYTGYSLCAWFYIEGQNTSHSGSAIISAGNWNNQVLNLSVSDWSSDHYTRLRISGTNWNNTYTYNFQKNIWYHVVVSSDGNKTYAYVNGVLLDDTASGFLPTNIEGTDMCIGGATYYAGMQFFGRINDVRIYDHCLSAKEVEEISKGLILHYKLDNNGLGNPNLLPCGGTYIQSSPWITTFNKVDGYAWVTNSAFRAIPGKTYTISVKCDGTLANTHGQNANPSTKSWTFWLYICNSDTTKSWQTGAYDSPINLTSVNHNYRKIGDTHVWTYTLSSTQEYISLRTNSYSNGTDNVTVKWWDMKVEEGDNFTGWSPNFSNASIIYDSSGYNNNGTIVGSLETITPSPKYSCATSFDNKEYIIHKLPENMYQATYSFWVKASSYTSYGAVYMPYQSPSAGTSPWFAINTESCKVWAYFGNNSPNYTKGSGTMPLNEWHHCVYVWNNGVAQWYVDGEKTGNSVTYTGRTFIQNTANATIGNSFTGTNWNGTPFTGEISDFRIYATALTEAQIKELYKTSMIVDGSSVTARDLE